MPARKLRIGGASYDLAWARPLAGRANSDLILIAGGGGSGNTGVKNQVQVVRSKGQGEYELVTQFVTDSDGNQRFCCGICSGGWEGASLVGVALGTHCLVLSMEFDEAQSKASFTRLVEFEADFSKEDAGINCCCITPSSDVVTGGEDGVVRFWRLDKQQQHLPAGAALVSNTFCCSGHSAPIMALGSHPREAWVCSASKDGSCKIWDSKTGKLLADIVPISDGSGGSGAKASLTKMQCRGCCFSADGDYLYTIQCGRIGSTILIKYSLSLNSRQDAGDTPLMAVAKKTTVASKSPSTRLVISGTGEYIAVGCSSGAVAVFDSETLAKVFSGPCHDDQPVLGLAFAPRDASDAERAMCVFVTCSVDSFMTSTAVHGSSVVAYLLIAVLFFLFFFLFLHTYQ